MRGLSFGKGMVAAAKADFLSLTAWQVGMYGWMAIATFLVFGHENPENRLAILVHDADRHAGRISNCQPSELVAAPGWDQRENVM